MKTTKRIAAAAASLALALSMAVTVSTTTAFADDDNVARYDLEADALAFGDSDYYLYQIFVGNYDATGKLIVDSDLRLGDSFENEAQELAFYQSLSLFDAADQTPAKAVDKLDNMNAEYVLDKLSGLELEPVLFGPQLSGYYFMTETKGTGESAVSANHLVKLNGDVTVTPKAGKPDVEKKVKEDDRDVEVGTKFDVDLYGLGYNDVADVEIGQDVPFQLVGTIPTNIARFDHYFYEFSDTLEAAKFEDPENLTVQFVWGLERYTANINDYVVSERDENGTFTITFNDIKSAYKTATGGEEITPDVKVVVSYTSELTGNASINKAGNVNEVKLTYSTNTSYTGEGYTDSQEDQEKKGTDTDDTDEDGVVVFTYYVDVSKIDALSEEKIGTAEFVLLNSDASKVAAIDRNGIINAWVDLTNTTNLSEYTFSVDENTTFLIKGLDTYSTYKLREVTAPTGYELLNSDIPVQLVLRTPDTLNINGTWTYQTGDGVQRGYSAWDSNGMVDVADKANLPAKVTVNDSTNDVKVAVKNTKHATLPETGGMGTKLFYIFGGAAVIGSGVILVARKRAKDAE